MKNKFIEKQKYGTLIWELQIKEKIPCTEEERLIYGVEYKINHRADNPIIVKKEYNDGDYYYEAYSGRMMPFDKPIFKSLEKAKEFLIKEFEGNDDK
jgi:hypothetical protein